MVTQTRLNLSLISFICGFVLSLAVLILLDMVGVGPEAMAPIFTIGVAVLSYLFYTIGDIKNILVYSLIAIGLLFLLFPMFMYLSIPGSLPEYEISISTEQAIFIGLSTGISALVLALAILKSPLKSK
ncbi:MAG: hypothetical protein ABIG39_06225 [Candidatus Micrarchaeota archaeon]